MPELPSDRQRQLVLETAADIRTRPDRYAEAGRWLDQRFSFDACMKRLAFDLRNSTHSEEAGHWLMLRRPLERERAPEGHSRPPRAHNRAEARRIFFCERDRLLAALRYYTDDPERIVGRVDACRIALLTVLLLDPDADALPPLTEFQRDWPWADRDDFVFQEKLQARRPKELFGSRHAVWMGLDDGKKRMWERLTERAWAVLARELREQPMDRDNAGHTLKDGGSGIRGAGGKMEYPEHVRRIAWQVDTLIADSATRASFREMLEQFARNVEADGARSRWSFFDPGQLDLADRYALLAAIHDAICGRQSLEIMPADWWPKDSTGPKHALRYVALGGAGAPHLKDGAQLQAFLDQIRADLCRRSPSQVSDGPAAEPPEGVIEALQTAGMPTAASELGLAMEGLRRRPKPDVTGAVSHAMGALECVAREVSGDRKGTLGQIIKRHPDLFPPPWGDIASKLWGHASEHARHGREDRKLSAEDARLLVSHAVGLCGYRLKEK